MPRDKIKLVSKGKTAAGVATRTFYTTTKNKRTSTEKLSLMKFDPRAVHKETGKLGAHVEFVEEKMK